MSDKFGYVYEDPSTANQITGSTPYGTYDSDTQFVTDSLPVIKWIARRLGHPVMQLEFSSGSLYACYEEAVSEFSSLTYSHTNGANRNNDSGIVKINQKYGTFQSNINII